MGSVVIEGDFPCSIYTFQSIYREVYGWTEYDYNKADHLTIGEFGPILMVSWRNRVVKNAMNIQYTQISFETFHADKIDLAE